jgi:diguanylate cyclase (GGDEF)-like protein
MSALIKALKAIADEPVHSRMIDTIIRTAVEFAGAQQGALILRDSRGGLCVEAEASVDGGDPLILQSIPVEQSPVICQPVVNYVARTRSSLVVHDAQQAHEDLPGLHQDPYIRDNGVRSVLCLPIVAATSGQPELIGVLYLENNRASNSFTEERFGTLEIICMSAAGRLELSRKAAVDGLTELFNHDYFQNMLRQEMAASLRQGRSLSVILADIDHFKRFNDTWGHQLGDQVLREVARIIRQGCRESDIAARYGGEEIAVILPDTDLEAAGLVAERLRGAVEQMRVDHAVQSL